MSFFSKVFGVKKEIVMTPHEAIQNLHETEGLLIKKQEFLEKKIEQEIEIAKKNGSKNKRAAIQALKRKKRFEKQLQQIDGTLSTLEMQRQALEDANMNTATISTMKKAAEALKNAHQNLDADTIHDIMDEISEQQDLAREISDVISTPFGNDIDEDDLERELEELEQEELDKDLLNVVNPHRLPDVPNGDPKETVSVSDKKNVSIKSTEEEDDDIKMLSSWAS